MQELQPFLAAEFGLMMPGWTLTEATDITPDGRVIVGNGTNPSGDPEGWKVDLSQITDTTWAGGNGSWDDGDCWKYGWFPCEWYWNRAAPGAVIVQRWLDAGMRRGLPAVA